MYWILSLKICFHSLNIFIFLQLLATSMSNVVKFLISVNDDDEECDEDDVTNSEDVWRTCDENRTGGNAIERSSSVRVLTSVSRVTIGSPIVSEITRRKIARRLAKSARASGEVSRLGTRSFRLNNVTSREEKRPKRHAATSALIVDETMNKLTSLTPKLPYVTRKISCQSGTEAKLELAKDFNLSNILNSPRIPTGGREKPRKNISTFNPSDFSAQTRSPLKVISNSCSIISNNNNTNINITSNNKSQVFSHKNLGLAEFAKYAAITTSSSLGIGSPERLADIELIDKRIDMLLKTS